ncbi:MAG: lactate utilization protein B [Actinomycetota bacterium]
MSKRLHAMTSLKDSEALRDIAAEVRDAVLSQLDVHLDRLASNWERNGGRVFFAADASEATDYVLDIAKRVEAKLVVKSKSMASEEIRLNEALIEQGIEPVETDLGEFIIQLAGEHPSHIITPAIHRSKEDVAALFGPLAGRVLPAETGPLAAFARAHLSEQFLRADIGINGVNFGIADEGALCLVTNEGNGRMCNALPRVHIAIMGMERVAADWDQLAVMLSLLARSATGQKLTQYTSITFGPRPSGEYDGPDESHLIILDNGRSRALGTDQQSILRCIRCGACLNVCPVYRQVGGHAYDPVYSGPIGAVLNPTLRENATELAHASSLLRRVHGSVSGPDPSPRPPDRIAEQAREPVFACGASRLQVMGSGVDPRHPVPADPPGRSSSCPSVGTTADEATASSLPEPMDQESSLHGTL